LELVSLPMCQQVPNGLRTKVRVAVGNMPAAAEVPRDMLNGLPDPEGAGEDVEMMRLRLQLADREQAILHARFELVEHERAAERLRNEIHRARLARDGS
jgi:hypothetical protein